MDSTKQFNSKHSSQPPYSVVITELDETACGLPCQHPSCWASQRRKDMGTPRILPLTNLNTSSSDDEIDLPVQSICNLLSDYGNGISDYYPGAARECVSQQWHTRHSGSAQITPSCSSQCKLSTSNAKASSIFKPVYNKVKDCIPHLVDTKELFDKANFRSGRDELFLRKQFYVWVANPRKNQEKLIKNTQEGMTPQSVLMKDLTECMIPKEISQKRQSTVLKKYTRTRPRPAKLSVNKSNVRRSNTAPFGDIVQSERYSPSKRKLESVFQEHSHDIGQTLDDSINSKNSQMLSENKKEVSQSTSIVDLDDNQVLNHSVLPNVLARQKTTSSSFPGFRHRLPNVTDDNKKRDFISSQQTPDCPSKVTAVSLGLPELPTGVQTTKPFSYRRQGLDLSLGPVKTLSSSDQNILIEDHSDHCTTVQASAPSTQFLHLHGAKHNEEETAVNPALATHIAAPPAATSSRLLELCPPAEHWPLLSEMSADGILPSLVSETDPPIRANSHWLLSRGKDEPGKTDQGNNKKLLDVRITADSPAPPPPSPEPRVITLSSRSPVSNERDATVFPIQQVQ